MIDISNPASPIIVGESKTASNALDVDVIGAHAYVAVGGAGLQIIDVTNPTVPMIVGQINTPWHAGSVKVVGQHAYIASGGLQVVDITTPSAPILIGGVSASQGIVDVAVSGDHAFAVAALQGVKVFAAQCGLTTPVLIRGLEAAGELDAVRIRWEVLETVFAGFTVLRASGFDPREWEYEIPRSSGPG